MPAFLESFPQTNHRDGTPAAIDPNAHASPLRVAMVGNAYHEQLFAGVAAHARQAGWDLDVTCFFNPGCLPKQECWDGVLAAIPLFEPIDQWMREIRCPAVELLESPLSNPDRPRVTANRHEIGRCGASHLLELGNIRFGYYRAFAKFRDCGNGFVEEMGSRGFAVSMFGLDLCVNNADRTRTTRPERVAWLCERLGKMTPPMAIMAEDDRFAVDLCFAARALGLRVPDDLAILGTDDQGLVLSAAPVAISSVDTNFFEVGRRGAETLDRMMSGAAAGSEEVPFLTQVSPKGVVARKSTSTFVCEDPAVAIAAMFVRRRFREPISVADVAAAAGISVRSLQAKYPVHLGRGVKEDILWYRLMEAKSLIERTNLKVSTVAAESGFGTSAHLHRVFQQVLESTPHAWRMRHGRGNPAR